MKSLKTLTKRASVVICASTGIVIASHAAIPAEVTTAVETAKTDGVAFAATVFGAFIAIAVIGWLRSAWSKGGGR